MRTSQRAHFFAAFCLACAFGAPATARADTPLDAAARHDMTFAGSQLAETSRGLAPKTYPFFTDSAGAWTTTGPGAWSSGFLAGSLWLQYRHTGRTQWIRRAEAAQAGLESQKKRTSTSDLGFMLLDSFGQGYRLTGDGRYRRILLRAADSLARRYDSTVGCIRSWGTASGFRVIVDTMMNLELLFWAADHGGGGALYDMAVNHALRTRENSVRPDGSTYQVVDYDPATGNVLERGTHAGYDAESTWSRGQAWAIYGFAIAFRETGDRRFLGTARRTADFYLAHLPADGVPYWDFGAPGIPFEPKDSSAAAVAASGLLLLARLDPNHDRRRGYGNAARATIRSLSSSFTAQGSSNDAVLQHGTYSEPEGNTDTGLIWGDYFFEEALLRYRLLPPRARALTIRGVTTDTDPGDAAATIDGLQSTWWTALDRGRLTYDLGRRRTVDKIGISFRRGDARATGIRVLTSRDRIHWGVAVSALSSSETSGQEIFDFPDRRARFVKIVTLGNSLGGRATISEIHVY